MESDPGTRLSDLARRPSRELDMAEVERRGRRGRLVAVASRSLLIVAVTVAVATSAGSQPFGGTSPDVRPGEGTGVTDDAAPPTRLGPDGEVFELVSEQTQAEIFAFRALAATELMDPYGRRTYNWTSGEDTAPVSEGWRVGFAASDCAPRGNSQTCTGLDPPLDRDDPELDDPVADTFIIVSLDAGEWTVTDVEGNMLPEERNRIIGYSLPQKEEPSHWDFASVGLMEEPWGLAMSPIWVGPFPTVAPGSVCEVQAIDSDGNPVGEATSFFQGPPAQEYERAGGVRGGGGGGTQPSDAVDATVNCEQYTGVGWEIASEPTLVGASGDVTGVVVDLVWRGERGVTTGARCTATLEDREGNTVFEGSGTAEALWRPGDFKRYPYKTNVFVSTRGESVDAERIGEFECVSR